MKKVSCNETTVFLGKMLSDITGFLVIHVMSINTSVSICSLVHCVVCRSIVQILIHFTNYIIICIL